MQVSQVWCTDTCARHATLASWRSRLPNKGLSLYRDVADCHRCGLPPQRRPTRQHAAASSAGNSSPPQRQQHFLRVGPGEEGQVHLPLVRGVRTYARRRLVCVYISPHVHIATCTYRHMHISDGHVHARHQPHAILLHPSPPTEHLPPPPPPLTYLLLHPLLTSSTPHSTRASPRERDACTCACRQSSPVQYVTHVHVHMPASSPATAHVHMPASNGTCTHATLWTQTT